MKMKDEKYLQECEERRKIVANTLAVGLTATEGPNEAFLNALDDYIAGRLSLEELTERTKQMEYVDGEVNPADREKHRQNREKYRQKRLQDFMDEDPAEKQKRLNFESDARTHTDW